MLEGDRDSTRCSCGFLWFFRETATKQREHRRVTRLKVGLWIQLFTTNRGVNFEGPTRPLRASRLSAVSSPLSIRDLELGLMDVEPAYLRPSRSATDTVRSTRPSGVRGDQSACVDKFIGEADWFLGMSIVRDRKGKLLWLHQKSYAETVLEEFGMHECRGVNSPGAQIELSKQQCPSTPEEIEQMRKIPYRQAVGSLMYLANCTRPDLAHASTPRSILAESGGGTLTCCVADSALPELHHALRTSIRSHGIAIAIGKFIRRITRCSIATLPSLFADANWGSCKDSRRLTTGWLIQLCGGWIDWSCKKQETVALSSCEAEYVAASSATAGVTWTVQLLSEIGFLEWISGGASLSAIPVLLSDNRSAIAMANTDSLHSRSKHIDIRRITSASKSIEGSSRFSGSQCTSKSLMFSPTHSRRRTVRQVPLNQGGGCAQQEAVLSFPASAVSPATAESDSDMQDASMK